MKTDKTKIGQTTGKSSSINIRLLPPPDVWEELSRARSRRILSEKNHLVGSRLYYTFALYFYRVTIPPSDYRLKQSPASNKNIRLGANGSTSNAKYCTLDKTGTTRYNSPIL